MSNTPTAKKKITFIIAGLCHRQPDTPQDKCNKTGNEETHILWAIYTRTL